jgi:hypothetical protein
MVLGRGEWKTGYLAYVIVMVPVVEGSVSVAPAVLFAPFPLGFRV